MEHEMEHEMEIDMEPEMETEIGLEPVLLDEQFEEWLKQNVTEEGREKFKAALIHFNDNGLIAKFLNNKNPGDPRYNVYIKGPYDDDNTEISFDFGRQREGAWYFGIQIEDMKLTNASRQQIDMTKKGYSRLLMVLMFYCLEKKVQKKPTDLIVGGDQLLIGIDADASGGFWENMGMLEGKYSMDGPRRESKVGAAVGFDKEFQMKEWKKWLQIRCGAWACLSKKKKKSKSKKSKKKKKHTKRKKKRKSKRKSKQRRKSKMR